MTATMAATGALEPSPGNGVPAATGSAVVRRGHAEGLGVEQVVERLWDLPVWSEWSRQRRRAAEQGARHILRWLASWPGSGWQQR
jgi:citrate lyase beta subunit